MYHKYQRHSDHKFKLMGLMVEKAHAQQTSQSPPEEGRDEQGKLAHAPVIPFCFFLVDQHLDKAPEVYHQKVYSDGEKKGLHFLILSESQELSNLLHFHCSDLGGKAKECYKALSIMMVVEIAGLKGSKALVVKGIG